MKYKLRETHFNKKSLWNHLKKHMNQYINDDRFLPVAQQFAEIYDRIGHELSEQPVGLSDGSDGSRYIGYIDKKGRNCKYDKQTGDFVVYTGRTHTLHKKNVKQYMGIRNRDFDREFPYNEDLSNKDEKEDLSNEDEKRKDLKNNERNNEMLHLW